MNGPPNLVTIDLDLVQGQVDEAERRYQAAVAQRDRVVAEHDSLVEEADMEMRQAKMTLAFVQEAAVSAEREAEPVPDRRSAWDGLPVDAGADVAVEVVDLTLRPLPTKVAALQVLHDNPEKVFSLHDLHVEMMRHGFQGSHNSVHVAVSRQMKNRAPIVRVKKGHYQYATTQEAPTVD